MKKVGLIIVGIIICCSILITIKNYSNNQGIVVSNSNTNLDTMAIMIKESGSNTYKSSSSPAVPRGSYLLNYEKTYCENGENVLNYDSSTGKISISTLGADKCYLYFDYYQAPVINKVSFTVGETSISLNVTSTKGTNDITNYYYSNDSGKTFKKSANNKYSFTDLTACKLYNFVIYAEDTSGYKSELYKANKAPSVSSMLANKKILCDNNGQTYIDSVVQNHGPEYSNGETESIVNDINTNTNILYSEDDYGNSYFYVGKVNNNWLKFGKYQKDYVKYRGYISNYGPEQSEIDYDSLDECNSSASECREVKYASAGDDIYWRIVRINGDGTIRIVYNGTVAPIKETEYVLDSDITSIGSGYFHNEMLNDSTDSINIIYIRHYQFLEDTLHPVASSGAYDSNAKTYLENWYSNYFYTANLQGYISDQTFCNDRTLYNYYSNAEITDISTAKSSYWRSAATLRIDDKLSLKCSNDNDKFSATSKFGNASLNYSVGLLTMDEVALAGANGYLFNGTKYYFTMTPIEYYEYYGMSSFGKDIFMNFQGGETAFFKPVINLSSSVYFKGSGSWDDPYVIVN